MRKHWLAISFVLPLLLCAMPTAFAADKSADDEAKEAENEEQELAKLPGETASPLRGMTIKGVFTSQPSEGEKSAVLGVFKSDKQSYLVKTDSDDVRRILPQYNGKSVFLYGKERNKGKYLIVMNVLADPEAPANRRKKKGF